VKQLLVPPSLFEKAKEMFPQYEIIKQEWLEDGDWYLLPEKLK
jgi:hypothetical protein